MNMIMLEQLLNKGIELSYFNRLVNVSIKYNDTDTVLRLLGDILKEKDSIYTDINNLFKACSTHDINIIKTVELLIVYVDDLKPLMQSSIINKLKERTAGSFGTILISEYTPLSKIQPD